MDRSPLPGLSVFLITCNEADRLAETLAAVSGLASEIVVVDSGSTDATLTLTIINLAHSLSVLRWIERQVVRVHPVLDE